MTIVRCSSNAVGRFSAILIVTAVAASCGSQGSTTAFGSSSSGSGGPSSSGSGSTGPLGSSGGAGVNCAQNATAEGCACTNIGNTASCWTGDPARRGKGACHDGSTTCVRSGEFSAWGPCTGQVTDCGAGSTAAGDGGGGEDGGTGNGGGGGEDSGGGNGGGGSEMPCPCVPGATIWCDEDCTQNVYCSAYAQKTCLPNGTWGPCHETSNVYTGGCEHVLYGCDECNSQGKGFYIGDCSKAFTCAVPQWNCGMQGHTGPDGKEVITCTCN